MGVFASSRASWQMEQRACMVVVVVRGELCGGGGRRVGGNAAEVQALIGYSVCQAVADSAERTFHLALDARRDRTRLNAAVMCLDAHDQ